MRELPCEDFLFVGFSFVCFFSCSVFVQILVRFCVFVLHQECVSNFPSIGRRLLGRKKKKGTSVNNLVGKHDHHTLE